MEMDIEGGDQISSPLDTLLSHHFTSHCPIKHTNKYSVRKMEKHIEIFDLPSLR